MQALAAGAFTAVFLVALVAKLDGWAPWASAVGEWFGSSPQAAVARVAIPASEGAAVVVLIASQKWGLFFSAVLLLAFGFGAAYLTVRGVRSTCACFGAASSSQISFKLAARNILLGALAATAGGLATSSPSQPVAAVLAAALVAVGATMAQEYRQLIQIHRAPTEENA